MGKERGVITGIGFYYNSRGKVLSPMQFAYGLPWRCVELGVPIGVIPKDLRFFSEEHYMAWHDNDDEESGFKIIEVHIKGELREKTIYLFRGYREQAEIDIADAIREVSR